MIAKAARLLNFMPPAPQEMRGMGASKTVSPEKVFQSLSARVTEGSFTKGIKSAMVSAAKGTLGLHDSSPSPENRDKLPVLCKILTINGKSVQPPGTFSSWFLGWHNAFREEIRKQFPNLPDSIVDAAVACLVHQYPLQANLRICQWCDQNILQDILSETPASFLPNGDIVEVKLTIDPQASARLLIQHKLHFAPLLSSANNKHRICTEQQVQVLCTLGITEKDGAVSFESAAQARIESIPAKKAAPKVTQNESEPDQDT